MKGESGGWIGCFVSSLVVVHFLTFTRFARFIPLLLPSHCYFPFLTPRRSLEALISFPFAVHFFTVLAYHTLHYQVTSTC